MIVPDAIEPIIAWRIWDYSSDVLGNPCLHSKNRSVWEPKRRMVATCPQQGTRQMRVRGWQIRNLRGETHWIRDLERESNPRQMSAPHWRTMSAVSTSCVAAHVMMGAMGATGPVGMGASEEEELKPPNIELAAGWQWEFATRLIDIPPSHLEIPGKECSCGIYACKTLQEVRSQTHGDFFGEVYLWGRVEEGYRGYRAQYAYPKSLYLEKHSIANSDELSGLRRIFGLEVEEGASVPVPRSFFRRMVWWA